MSAAAIAAVREVDVYNLQCFLCRLLSSVIPVEDKQGKLHFMCRHCLAKNKVVRREAGDPPYVVTGIDLDPEP
jgi:hypothetical protein